MRIDSGTYIAAAARLMAALAVLLAAGCGGKEEKRTADGPLTVYLSVPRNGVQAAAGEAVTSGARLALSDARGMAGDREVRLVPLDDSKPKGQTWDPAAVEANANRAAEDDSTIAYIGELDQGGSAISVPVTNEEEILQVSPLDGLTTLTRDQPAAPVGTGPARYYPTGKRTFMRLVPPDALQAAELVRWAREQGAQRIAIVQDDQVFGRVLAQQAAVAAERERMTVTDLSERHDDPAGYDDFARRLATGRPDAVIYTGGGDAKTGLLLAAIGRALPAARLYGSSALASALPAPPGLPEVQVLSPLLPASEYGPKARRLLDRVEPEPRAATGAEALYGYEAMRVVLDAIADADGQPGDRAAVVKAALLPRSRTSAIGDYEVLPGGDVSTARFAAYRRSATGVRYLGVRLARR
jgi:branched-chain amino acid transport system substrate-binding protein